MCANVNKSRDFQNVDNDNGAVLPTETDEFVVIPGTGPLNPEDFASVLYSQGNCVETGGGTCVSGRRQGLAELKEQKIPRLNTVAELSQGIVKTNENKTNEYTILLIGETGTGKTSLLSLLANVLAGLSPRDYILFHDESNEAGGAKNQSQTNLAIPYEFTSKNGVKVRILDTPGLADTRGLAQDDLHKASIAHAIKENISTVNAVIILTNGTMERLGVATDYALTTLSAMFPRTLANNIGLLFTYVPNRLSWNFDRSSLPAPLRKNRNNQFLLDNPLGLWKKFDEIRKAWNASDSELAEYDELVNEAHRKALRELCILFDWLDVLSPQPTNEILMLYERYQEIERKIANALSRASQLANKKAELKRIKDASAGNGLTMTEYEQYSQTTTEPVWEQVNASTLNHMCYHPQCYSNCYIWSGFAIIFRIKLFFWHFQGIRAPYYPCVKCGHPYENHRTRNLLWVKKNHAGGTVDEDAQQKYIDAKQEPNKEQRKIIVDFDKTIERLDKESEEALTTLGQLIEAYTTVSLMGSFAGQVKKSIRLLEMHLRTMQQQSEVDQKKIQELKLSLENMKVKLEMVEEAGKKARNDGMVTKFLGNAGRSNVSSPPGATSLDHLVHMGN
ncbi:hypothetical protein APHAL10511_000445 [Amanita phalloides]|nr:hypothetical protein APHAL10511_000445 [Amanita phalloides]